MPEIDHELENVRLNAALDRLATAALKDSARWEMEITKLSAELGRYILLRKSAADEIATLRALLRFAVANKANFCEHDPDGVKATWIESAEDALLKE